MLLAALAALALGMQDDVSRLLEKLRSDEYSERESAQRALERMGLPVLDRLKAEAAKDPELDTKIRLKTLIEKIPRLAELAKVYGPTRRITLSAKDEPLGTLLEKLGAGLGEQIRGEGLDPEAKATIALEDVTLWEALDRVARATRTHWIYRKDNVGFLPGEAPTQPVVYYEQFRISVVEVKRIEYRAPGVKDHAVIVMPEVRYQRNLSPAGSKYRKVFTIDGFQSPTGANAEGTRPLWAYTSTTARREFALEEYYFVDPSVATFSIAGKAVVNFAQDSRELTFPLTGEAKEESTADGSFKLAGVKGEEGRTIVSLEIEVPDAGGLDDRFKGIWVLDAEGKKHLGTELRLGRDGKHFRPAVWFAVPVDKAKTLVFRWMTGLHALEVPFLLRDIKVP